MFVLAVLAGCRETELLDGMRDRLETFQTLFVTLGDGPPPGGYCGSSGSTGPKAVLRLERSTGRFTYDREGDLRLSWDGTTLWRDTSRVSPAERAGAEADVMFADLVREVMGGLNNTDVYALGEQAVKHPWGVRIDLPYRWDDAYEVLATPDAATNAVRSLSIVRRDTGKAASLFPWMDAGETWMRVEWDVRLSSDLSEPESLESRTRIVPYDDGTKRREGPRMLPGWHEVTTHNPLVLDTELSFADVGRHVEIEQSSHLAHTCTAAGRTRRPFELWYDLDLTHESLDFLPDALAAGCPISVDGFYIQGHHAVPAVNTRVHMSAELLEHSWFGPTVTLAQTTVDHTNGEPKVPRGKRPTWLLVTSAEAITNERSLSVRLVGYVEVECPGPVAGVNSVTFAMSRSPELAWDGCYPELGIIPDEPQIPK